MFCFHSYKEHFFPLFIAGNFLCDISNPIKCTTRIRAKVVVFNIEVPITRGYPVSIAYLKYIS